MFGLIRLKPAEMINVDKTLRGTQILNVNRPMNYHRYQQSGVDLYVKNIGDIIYMALHNHDRGILTSNWFLQ